MTSISENCVELFGQIASDPVFSHTSHGERFISFQMEVRRLSGTLDRITILAVEKSAVGLRSGYPLGVRGQMRSFNNHSGEGTRLVITVLAREFFCEGEAHINSVVIRGVICKPPVCRKTPMGREICDLMLAVNRKYGRADYLPFIAWGRHARQCSELSVGCELLVSGRIQSRTYIKILEDGSELEKNAFEISINELEIVPTEQARRIIIPEKTKC